MFLLSVSWFKLINPVNSRCQLHYNYYYLSLQIQIEGDETIYCKPRPLTSYMRVYIPLYSWKNYIIAPNKVISQTGVYFIIYIFCRSFLSLYFMSFSVWQIYTCVVLGLCIFPAIRDSIHRVDHLNYPPWLINWLIPKWVQVPLCAVHLLDSVSINLQYLNSR